ncbi:MAG: CehA/McbA family metallohydrolase, partial [Planctomycetota bacterium]
MRITSPYTEPQRWLKGNLHVHTNRSDGTDEPDDLVAMYRDDNYDFLSITDHLMLSEGASPAADGMIMFRGEECNTETESGKPILHIVAIDTREQIGRRDTGQEIVDEIKRQGGLSIVAHPRWSFLPYEMFDELTGYDVFEVLNGGCVKGTSRGIASDYWDRYMTRRGRAIFAVGTDDGHGSPHDFATGWTWVNSEKDPRAILEAVRAGNCYASSGPRIETIRVDDESITLFTSSARTVKFVSLRGETRAWVDGEHVKRATYRPKGDEVYV